MLHGMGIRLVLVLGAQPQIDRYIIAQKGSPPKFASGYEHSIKLCGDQVPSNTAFVYLPLLQAACLLNATLHHFRYFRDDVTVNFLSFGVSHVSMVWCLQLQVTSKSTM